MERLSSLGLTDYIMVMMDVRKKYPRSQLWNYMNRLGKIQSECFENDYRIIANEVNKYNIIL